MKTRAWLVILALVGAALVSATSRAAVSYSGQVVIGSGNDLAACNGYYFVTLSGDVASCRTLPDAYAGLVLGSWSAAANGTLVLSGELESTNPLMVSHPDGSLITADANSRDFDAAISPDGSKIVFARYLASNQSQGSNIYTINPDGSDRTLIAAGIGSVLSGPKFSPDGSTIAYSCSYAWGGVSSHCGPLPDGSYRSSGLMLMDADGGHKRMILAPKSGPFPGSGAVESISWSPDGRMIAVGGTATCPKCTPAAGGFNSQVFLYHTNGSDLFNLNTPSLAITHEKDDFGALLPQYTPDGKIMYLKTVDDNGYEGNWPYLINADGTGRHEIFLVPKPDCPKDDACGPPSWGMVVPAATGGGPGPMVNATRIKVPAVRGLGYTVATKRLTTVHLTVGTVARQYSSAIPAGHVIKQYPLPGSVAHRKKWKGPPVNLVLSRGPQG